MTHVDESNLPVAGMATTVNGMDGHVVSSRRVAKGLRICVDVPVESVDASKVDASLVGVTDTAETDISHEPGEEGDE